MVVLRAKKFFRLFTHYGRTDDLEKDPNSGRKETRHYANHDQMEAGYEAIIEEKTGKKGYRKVEMASGNIGSEKARAKHATTKLSLSTNFADSAPLQPASSLHPIVHQLIEYIYSEATSRLTATVSAKVGGNHHLQPTCPQSSFSLFAICVTYIHGQRLDHRERHRNTTGRVDTCPS